MDTLYYSNFCKHCDKIKQFIVKRNIVERVNAICVDKRTKDSQTGQYIITLENGKRAHLPPNIHSVPSLLLNSNHDVMVGNDIIKYFGGGDENTNNSIQQVNMKEEPSGFDLGNNGISEQFTPYSANISEKTQYSRDNFVNANHHIQPIRAEPDTFKPNKNSPDVTIDKLHNYRNEDMKRLNGEDTNHLLDTINQSRTEDNIRIVGSYPLSPH
jgi:hypothetical protein